MFPIHILTERPFLVYPNFHDIPTSRKLACGKQITLVQQALSGVLGWHRGEPSNTTGALKVFYRLLLEPLVPRLRGKKGLYLVPHDYLHAVPLHACCDSDGRSLADQFSVVYLPSASLLPQLPPLKLNGKILTLGNPEQQTTMSLPFSEWEAQHLHRRLGLADHRVLVGAQARWETTRQWSETGITQLSCHGLGVPSFAALSHLRLADDLLLAHDVVYRCPPLLDGALAILNGCQTGVRDERAIDEAFGLMTAFLLRGASLVLATHWPISDLCAAEFVVTFLTHLVKEQKSPTEAMKLAQTRVRELSAEEVQARCDELLQRFSAEEFPFEVAKVCNEAMRASLESGDVDKADQYVERGTDTLQVLGGRDIGLIGSPHQLQNQEGGASPKKRMYDHPIHWAAFYLIGRAT